MDYQSHTPSRFVKELQAEHTLKHDTLEFSNVGHLLQDAVYDSRDCNAPNRSKLSKTWGYTDQPFEQACHIAPLL